MQHIPLVARMVRFGAIRFVQVRAAPLSQWRGVLTLSDIDRRYSHTTAHDINSSATSSFRNSSPSAILKTLASMSNSSAVPSVETIADIAHRLSSTHNQNKIIEDADAIEWVAATASALAETTNTEAAAVELGRCMVTMGDMMRTARLRGEMTMSYAQLIKCLSVLKAFSEFHPKHSWDVYFHELAKRIDHLSSPEAEYYSRRHKLSPHMVAEMLSSFQCVSALFDMDSTVEGHSANEVSEVSEVKKVSEATRKAARVLLGSFSAMAQKRMAGRVNSGQHLALAFSGIRGMSNAHIEVRNTLALLRSMISRLKRQPSAVSGTDIAECLGSMFNMSPSNEPSNSSAANDTMVILISMLSKAKSIKLSDVGIAMTSTHGFTSSDSLDSVVALFSALRNVVMRTIDLPSADTPKEELYFPFYSFACSVYYVSAISEEAHEAVVNSLLLQLCMAYEKAQESEVNEVIKVSVEQPVWSAAKHAAYDQFFTADLNSVCLAVYGLRENSGNSSGVRRTLAILNETLMRSTSPLSVESLTYALCGLSMMSSDCEEMLALINTLSIAANRSSLVNMPNGELRCEEESSNKDIMDGENAALCLSALGNKESNTAAIQAVLSTIRKKLEHSFQLGHLQMTDSDISLAFQGLVNMVSTDSADIGQIRRVLRGLLEANYRSNDKGIAASDAAIILSSLSNEDGTSKEIRDLLGVLAGRIEESTQYFNNEGAAMAMSGLQSMSNEVKEVQYLVAALSAKCFIAVPSGGNQPVFQNSDVVSFLSGFKNMVPGLRDEDLLTRFLGRALMAMKASRPTAAMSEADFAISLNGLFNLTCKINDDGSIDSSKKTPEINGEDVYNDNADKERLQHVLADIKLVLSQRSQLK